MAQQNGQVNGQVRGKVTYREGDGILMEIPRGPCKIALDELDVTLTWSDGDVHGVTAMPRSDFERYVADGDLALD